MAKAHFSSSSPAFIGFVIVLMVLHLGNVNGWVLLCDVNREDNRQITVTSCDNCESSCQDNVSRGLISGFRDTRCSGSILEAIGFDIYHACSCCL
ncbi:hypothetical protein MKW94_019299 [Papaver nudicaule]|uniref:Uncharacterized protein n=1 Tax=Papaver nudicaule TaxID=74823 RepID=A0AA41SHY4_PAPNU|nr:hypothetical protein [Papaver nudicaule]